jgi:hypothetical protein
MQDLRRPIGIFFSLLAAILLALSFLSDARAPLTQVNVNFYAGLAIGAFGAVMLWLSRRRA